MYTLLRLGENRKILLSCLTFGAMYYVLVSPTTWETIDLMDLGWQESDSAWTEPVGRPKEDDGKDGEKEQADGRGSVLKERLMRVEGQCDKLLSDRTRFTRLSQYNSSYLLYPPSSALLHVSQKHKLAVCVPFKAGSETWRYLLQSLTDRPADLLPQVEDNFDFGGYTKAIQVRHPFERLVSAYRYCFESGILKENMHLNKRVMEKYNYLPASKDLRGLPSASFAQFIQFIVRGHRDFPGETQLLTNGSAIHWHPYFMQCNPCHADFRPDYILHMETWEADTHYFLKSNNLNTSRDIYLLNMSSGGHSSHTDKLRHYFGQIDKDMLQQLYNIYWIDFQLFGYEHAQYFDYVV